MAMGQETFSSPSAYQVPGAIAQYRAVKLASDFPGELHVEYATADGYDAIGVTQEERSTADYTAGLTSTPVRHFAPGEIIWVTVAGEVTALDYAVVTGTAGKFTLASENVTPADTYVYGQFLESATEDGDIIPLLVRPGYIKI